MPRDFDAGPFKVPRELDLEVSNEKRLAGSRGSLLRFPPENPFPNGFHFLCPFQEVSGWPCSGRIGPTTNQYESVLAASITAATINAIV